MFNLRSTENCDQEDDLLNEFLDCEDLSEAVLSGIENASNNQELPIQSDQPDDGALLSGFGGGGGGGVDNVPSNRIDDDLPSNSVPSGDRVTSREFADQTANPSSANSGKADELNRLFEDEDNQYSSNLINDQLILNSKDFVSLANQNLHEFLLFDRDRCDLASTNSTSKRRPETKPKLCDNVNSQATNSHSATSASSTPTKSQSGNGSSPQQLNVLNFKSSVFDRSKRKLLKLLLKLQEEEKNENNDLNGIRIRKDCQLLSRYIKEEKLSYLILKLHPQNQGYSISLKKVYDRGTTKQQQQQASSPVITSQVLETIKLPYEESELLDYIDNEQIPPMLVDVLDSNCDSDEHLDLFHFGKLFVEIQDYRKNANVNNQNYESKFVLLRPTAQTIFSDVEKLTTFDFNPNSIQRSWSDEEKLELEAKLVLATSDPICLDPNPLTFLSSNQLNYEKKWLNNERIRSVCKKSSQLHVNRAEKFSQLPAPKHLELFDFIKRKHSEKHVDIARDKVNKRINDYMFVKEKSLAVPKSCLDDVRKHSKSIEIPVKNDNSLTKLEEYVMEYTEQQLQRSYTTTSISIFYRQVDDTYFGQLNVEKSSKVFNSLPNLPSISNQSNSQSGSSCLFKLGNKLLTKKYIEQFIEILSEHGRKCIKITTKKPGETPKVNYTKKLFGSSNMQNSPPVDNPLSIKRIKVSGPNGSIVNLNPNYNTPSPNDYPSLSSSLNSPIQPIANSSMGLGASLTGQAAPILNHSLQQPPQCIKQELTQQHPAAILSNNLMHNPNDNSLPVQSSLLINNNNMNHVMSNPSGNLNNMNHRNHQAINTVPISESMPIPMPTKSPYAQMSILERNSSQMHQQQQQQPAGPVQQQSSIHPQNSAQQQQQQSNNLIANNPILNNLITSNTISTNLVQNNFIQLNTKTAKNINISNGYITNQTADSQPPQTTLNNSQPTYIDSTASLNPITISPVTSLNRLNSGKSETVAVILTTNPLPNSNFISTNSNTPKSNSMNTPSIIQITSSGQTTSTTSLPTGVNLGLARGQNLRLHNLVSLANVQGTNQCIALPISLMMAPTNPAGNAQPLNTNGNALALDASKDAHHQAVAGQPNVVLINNINSIANNLDHTGAQQPITYQPQTVSIGGTLGSLNCLTTNQGIHHTGLQPIQTASLQTGLPVNHHQLQSGGLHTAQLKANESDQLDGGLVKHHQTHFTAYNQHPIVSPMTNLSNCAQPGPIAIQIANLAANPLSEPTQQPPTATLIGGSQQVQLTLQKND